MPTTPDAIKIFGSHQDVLHAPTKMANAGGVAASGLEMSQNSLRLQWSKQQVDDHFRNLMNHIHDEPVTHGVQKNGHVDYFKGANIAGFTKAANATLA